MTPESSHSLESAFVRQWPADAWRDSHVVVAVSSGPDSVAMLRAIVAIKAKCGGGGEIFAAHFNHGLRGAEADADQAWLEAVCRRLDVPLEIGRADVSALAADRGDGLEAAARDARYAFLARTAEKLGARFVAVAHTADDQAETVLHRVLRGTGLAGLAGMPASRPLSPSVSLVRPLLAVKRSDVLEYLDAIGQDYRVDPTNADPRWTRNRLRNELLPLLRRQYNPAVDEALVRLAAQAGESQNLITEMADELAAESVVIRWPAHAGFGTRAARAEIDCSRLNATPPLLIREVCRIVWQRANWPMQAMGFDSWQLLSELIQGTRVEPANLPASIRASREKDTLVVENRG